MEFVILWSVIAGFAAYVASQKGRNPIVWFIIGFLFSILGLIAIAAVPSLSKDDKP
jgi:hypothetical protein